METRQPILGKVEKETLPNGTVTWALTSKLPLIDRQGRVIGNFGISRDITDIKKIEEALEAERSLLRSLIDNLPDYIYVKDDQGRYAIDNVAHRELLGAKTLEEVKGKTVFDFFPPEVAAQFTQDDEAVMRTGVPMLNQEELLTDPHGRRRWHATTKVPLRNSAGRITGIVGIARDITHRKQAEEELQRANADLARHKEGLQAALAELQKSHEELKAAQFQLIQAEKMQSVGRLAAGVAHEVKNPLAILKMGLEYLSKSPTSADPNLGLVLTDMGDAIKRADAIILGLLDFSVPHALDLHPESLNIMVEQSLALVRGELELASPPVKLIKELSEGLPQVFLDRNKTKQVFVNVLTNAIHAMPEGGLLTVRTFAHQLQPGELDHDVGLRLADRFRANETVAITEVLDTGTGISEEKLAKIFDPFYTTKPTGKGTGLGLTVTKKIIELHGGSIDIHNRPGGGVVVRIMFKV